MLHVGGTLQSYGLGLYSEGEIKLTPSGESWYGTSDAVERSLKQLQASLNAFFVENPNAVAAFNSDLWPTANQEAGVPKAIKKIPVDGKIGPSTWAAYLAFDYAVSLDSRPIVSLRSIAMSAKEHTSTITQHLSKPATVPATTSSKTSAPSTTTTAKASDVYVPEPTAAKSGFFWPALLLSGGAGLFLLASTGKKDAKGKKLPATKYGGCTGIRADGRLQKGFKWKSGKRCPVRGERVMNGLSRANPETAQNVRMAIARERAQRAAGNVRSAIAKEKLRHERDRLMARKRRVLAGLDKKLTPKQRAKRKAGREWSKKK